jgi:signal transduction histidine kinase/ActR/RegA family two-component response regulator
MLSLDHRSRPCLPPASVWTFVRRFAADAAGAHDLSSLIQQAACGLAEAVGAHAIGIASYGGFFDQAWIAIDHPEAGVEIMRLSLEELAHAADDTQRSNAILSLFERHGLEPLLVTPLVADGQPLGVIAIDMSGRVRPDEHMTDLLLLIGDQLAVAISRAHQRERLVRAERLAQQAYAELATQQQRNVQVEKLRALGELASGVAHEFNNLLAIILGHTELLKSPAVPHFTRSRRAIMQAAQDGARTVRRIQEFVRAQPEQHSTPVDLVELADDVLQLTRPRWRDGMQGRGTTIIVRQELHSVPRILGDAAELREVVTNLILNAVDAMPKGGTLTLATGADDGDVWLEVRDTGVGIAPEICERIFEPFYTTKAQRGTGLGLAVSRSIALRHGGALGVESTPGAGACFRLTLPAPATIPEPVGPAALHPAAPLTPLRVLLIDDDRGVRDTMVQLLAIDGHHVACARDGAEALRIFSPGAYDIVCSDLGMPGMSGWEVIVRLRERDAQPVMALLTGWGAQIDQSEAQARGVDFIVPKPIDMAVLRAALAAADKRRAGVSG